MLFIFVYLFRVKGCVLFFCRKSLRWETCHWILIRWFELDLVYGSLVLEIQTWDWCMLKLTISFKRWMWGKLSPGLLKMLRQLSLIVSLNLFTLRWPVSFWYSQSGHTIQLGGFPSVIASVMLTLSILSEWSLWYHGIMFLLFDIPYDDSRRYYQSLLLAMSHITSCYDPVFSGTVNSSKVFITTLCTSQGLIWVGTNTGHILTIPVPVSIFVSYS